MLAPASSPDARAPCPKCGRRSTQGHRFLCEPLTATPVTEWTETALARLIDELAEHSGMWDDDALSDPVGFVAALVFSGQTYFVDIGPGCGYVWFTSIQPGYVARFHVLTWSTRVAGRYDLLARACQHAMNAYNLHRIDTLTPFYARAAMRAVSRIPFLTREGVLREAFRRYGMWYDGILSSVLRSELTAYLEDIK